MSLIDRLKTQRESVEQELQNIEEHAKELAEIAAKAAADKHEKLREIADLAKAIAVLDTHEEELALEWVEQPTADDPVEPAEDWTNGEDEARPVYRVENGQIYINGELSATSKLVESIGKALEITKQLGDMVAPAIPERTSDESQAETATEQTPSTEAAYAPVNDEGLMWAHGIESEAKAKAEPQPEVKRPFWMLGKVDA